MADNIEALAATVEDWKQTKYHLIRLLDAIHGSDMDPASFRDEFVEDDHVIDEALFDLVMELEGAQDRRKQFEEQQ